MQTKKAFLKRVIEKGDALFNYSQEKKINHQFYYYYYHFNYKKKEDTVTHFGCKFSK